MNHVGVLDPFFHDNGEGELVRDKTPKGGWVGSAKDLRLARGYVLKATCRRRFLGWRTSILELSEREVSDFIGPNALRVVAAKEEEEEGGALLCASIDIPISKAGLQALDSIVGNDDGILVRQGKDFSYSCSDVSLFRATLLVASLPKRGGGMNLCVVVLQPSELKALRDADEKERQFKREMEEEAKRKKQAEEAAATTTSADPNSRELDPHFASEKDDYIKPTLWCCFPSQAKKKKKPTQQHPRSKASSVASNHVPNEQFVAPSPVVVPRTRVIGVPPPLPSIHKEAMERAIAQVGLAASSDPFDPSWKRVGSLDGLTWLMKDGGKQLMCRGTVQFPARSVFEYVWLDSKCYLEIEPRVGSVSSTTSGGDSQVQFYNKTVAKEWLAATASEDVGPETVLKHYMVHPDGTIFVVELFASGFNGLVISPALDASSCHVAWVEVDSQSNFNTKNLAPWALNRAGSISTKLLGDRLHHLRQFGLCAVNADLDIKEGSVVNANGTSEGEPSMEYKKKVANKEALLSKKLDEPSPLVVTQIQKTMDFVWNAIPDERKRFRNTFESFQTVMNSFLGSSRFLVGKHQEGAQYPFDCIMMWLLVSLPTQESWVETLCEQVSMMNVEAQTTFGRSEIRTDKEIKSRISQIMTLGSTTTARDERLPSL